MTMPDATIRPFELHMRDEDLADLRQRPDAQVLVPHPAGDAQKGTLTL